MKELVGIKFQNASKIYFFDANGIELALGDPVIVETARGMEYGTVASFPEEEKEEKRQLKKVLRKADEKDQARHKDNLAKAKEAMKVCEEKVSAHGLDMKLVDVEYTFDRSKIIFYFTSNGRVDFRELVKDLASVFRTRIELRQIGVRDEAKMMGGVGNCGRGLCCHEWMADFQPVSIKMAKTQNLSLNPTKISGICGRLMCCLKFENEVYQELGKGMPHVGERIMTPEGEAVVTDVNILIDKIKCRLIERITDDEGKEIEKFSSEFFSFGKEEIERQQKGKQNRPKQSKPKPKEQKEAPKEGEKKPRRRRNRKRKKKPEAVKNDENRG